MDVRAEPQAARDIIDAMVARMAKQFNPEKIILFGSFASGTPGPDSDADFLVVMPVTGSRRELAIDIATSLSGMGLPKDVFVATPEDVQRYGSVAGTIASIALSSGKVLYERPT